MQQPKHQIKILAPFNDEDAKFINEVDFACRAAMRGMHEEANALSLKGEDSMPLDMETLAWLKFIRGYGILYNRAVESGWLKGILTTDLPRKDLFDGKD